MAELAALPSFATAQLQCIQVQASHFAPKKVHLRTVKRKQFHGQCKILVWFPSHEVCELSGTGTLKGAQHRKQRSLRCECLGSLTNPDNPLTSNWVPVIDQILLISSVLFAYMAGIIPPEKTYLRAKIFIPEQDMGTSSSTSGCVTKSVDQINLECVWDEVQKKLVDALDAVDYDGNLDNNVIESENSSAKRPLSLHAIAVGPRLRLLLATFQQLRKEVENIPGSDEVANRDDWLVVLSESIRVSIQIVCVEWLYGELCMENNSHSKDILTRMFDKLKGDEAVLRYIRKSGKQDLYADFLFLLRFSSLGTRGFYDSKLITQHGIGILEDLLITVADGISCMYLELISVDSTLPDEMNSLGLSLCSLSSRELQRLRNEVTFNQWLHQNVESVISMYEDRFDLCALCTLPIKEPEMSQTDKLDWWKKFTLKKPAALPSFCHVIISQFSLPVKRTKELRALTGWRYYFSLFLELSDIAMPLLRVLFAKVSDAVSFFLVCLIGRSLGLIYRGIRQSIGWK